MRILVTGTTGQVGRRVMEVLRGQAPMTLDADFCNIAALRSEIREKAPEIIVNPAAYTAVDLAESETDLAFSVNADAVKVIAEEARNLGCCVIHFSTDYVYDGLKDGFYLETDLPNPQSVYGASKLAGEGYLKAVQPHHWILRTSWVFNDVGKNFLNTMLNLGRTKKELKIVEDQVGSPTSAAFLAKVVRTIVQRHKDRDPIPFGIYHATCSGTTSWYGFACFVFAKARELGEKLEVEDVQGIPTSAYPTPAKRPLNSRLNQEKLEKVLGWSRPRWEDEVATTLREILLVKRL